MPRFQGRLLWLACAVVWSSFAFRLDAGAPQAPPTSQAPASDVPTKAGPVEEEALNLRRREENGISVDAPKVYDDALLQQMLRAAEAKLAATQVIDQAGIAAKIGALSGASQRISSVGVNVQTPSIPGVTTTSKGATSTTVNAATDAVSVEGKPSSTDVLTTTEGAAAKDVVTTAPAMAPPAFLSPAASTAMPSTFSVSASDVLNEQMQLTYEIANLRLLLEGSLSDHVMVVKPDEKPPCECDLAADKKVQRYVKPRATLGFHISIDPQKRFKDAVAVVEVEIEPRDSFKGHTAAITALLPRDKTYNVAAITDSSTSIGAGVATGVVGVSGSWMTGHKTYYVTQDQDTVALTFTPKTANRVGFRWQFRPVLGKKIVRAGLKQTFVQVALPQDPDAPVLAGATIRTYWVKYDSKKGTLGDVVPDTLHLYPERPIARPPLAVIRDRFNAQSLTDLGGGQMLVSIPGRFLSGTYVRLGSTLVRDGAPNALFEHFGIRFVAPIADLATKGAALVARDGREEALTINLEEAALPKTITAKVSGLDDGSALLTVELSEKPNEIGPPLILVVGGRVFGYADAPVERKDTTIRAVVPAALVLASPEVTLMRLFGVVKRRTAIADLGMLNRAERLVLLEQGTASSRFLLYGSRLGKLKVLEPKDVDIGDIAAAEKETLRVVTIKTAVMKSHKQLVLQRDSERPFLLAMPGTAKAPAVKARERVVVDSDVALFDADSNDGLTKVVWQKQDIAFEALGDGKTIRVHGLKARGVTTALTTQTFEFTFEAGKASATIEIVNNRVETVAR